MTDIVEQVDPPTLEFGGVEYTRDKLGCWSDDWGQVPSVHRMADFIAKRDYAEKILCGECGEQPAMDQFGLAAPLCLACMSAEDTNND